MVTQCLYNCNRNQSLDSRTSHFDFTSLQSKSPPGFTATQALPLIANAQTFMEIVVCFFLTLNTEQTVLPPYREILISQRTLTRYPFICLSFCSLALCDVLGLTRKKMTIPVPMVPEVW